MRVQASGDPSRGPRLVERGDDQLERLADWEKFKAAVRPAFEKYRGIGVRIEDDMVVTPGGVRWMTEALPRKMSDIEDFIARARREGK